MSMTYKALDELLDIIITADNKLAEDLNTEAETRETEDTNIRQDLATNVSNINTAIDDLTSSTTASDQLLQNNINTVQSNLDNEANTRAEADTELDNKITNLDNSLKAYKEANDNSVKKVAYDLSAETSRATTAETGLSNRIRAVEDDYLTSTDKTELNNKIATNTNNISSLNSSIDAINNESTGILATAKSYADSLDRTMGARVDVLEAAVGEGGSVESQITNKINQLDSTVKSATVEAGKGLQVEVVETNGKLTSVSLTGSYNNTYDKLGSADAVQTALNNYKTSNDSAVATVRSTADSNKAAIEAINNADTGILKTAKNYADSLNTAMDSRVDILEAAIGDGGSVADKITQAIEELDSSVDSVDVDAGKGLKIHIEAVNGKLTSASLTGNYDNTYDKLGAAATAESNVNAKLNAYKTSNDAAVKKVSDNLASEVTRATGAESGLSTRIRTIEDDYLKAADRTNLQSQITSNTNAISVLNGTGAGSISKQVADAVAAIVADAPESYDTLKEISDWISSHADDASAMNSQINTNKSDISSLKSLVGTLPADTSATTIVEYIETPTRVTPQKTDYGEVGVWGDGNPSQEDRLYRFLTVVGENREIGIANSTSQIVGTSNLMENVGFLGNYTPGAENNTSKVIVSILGCSYVKTNDGTIGPNDHVMSDDNGYAVKSTNTLGYRVLSVVQEGLLKIIVSPNTDMIQRIKTDIVKVENMALQLKEEKLCEHNFLTEEDLMKCIDGTFTDSPDEDTCGDIIIQAGSISLMPISDGEVLDVVTKEKRG